MELGGRAPPEVHALVSFPAQELTNTVWSFATMHANEKLRLGTKDSTPWVPTSMMDAGAGQCWLQCLGGFCALHDL